MRVLAPTPARRETIPRTCRGVSSLASLPQGANFMLMRFLLVLGLLTVATSLAIADDVKKPSVEPRRPNLDRFFEQHDKNKDGFLDKSECPEQLKRRFDELDANKDGKLSKEEIIKGMPE